MPKTRRQYAGGAVASTLTGSVGATGVTNFSIASSTGWSVSSTTPFYVVVSPQTSSEEKMLVTLSSNTLTIVSRGIDGTSAASHAQGANIYPVFTAIDADEANELTSKYANRGSIVYQGASTFEELVKGTQGYPLLSGANDPAWGQIDTGGIKDDAVTSAKIAPGTIVNGDISGSAAIALSKLATGNLPTDIKVLDGSLEAAAISQSKVSGLTTALDGKLGSTATAVNASKVGGRTIFVQNATPTDKATGDIWFQVAGL